MSVHSSQKKKRKDYSRLTRLKTVGNHDEFLKRITKTLYYGKLPLTERFSLPVTELAAELYSEVKTSFSLERLRLEEAAEISRNACVSPCSFVLAMLYLEQLKTCNPSYVDKVASSELFLISLMVATKFLNDSGEEDDVLNSEWASSAGLTLKQVNNLEKDFLSAINWEVFVKESAFWQTLRGLEKNIALKEGKKRGWFTYTDLEVLMDYIDGLALAQAVFTVSAVCLASYTAGMLTVIGSTMLATQLPANYLSYRNSLTMLNNNNLATTSTPLEETTTYTHELLNGNHYNGSLEDFECLDSQFCEMPNNHRTYISDTSNNSELDFMFNGNNYLEDKTKDSPFVYFKPKYYFPLYYLSTVDSITRHLESIPLVGVMSK